MSRYTGPSWRLSRRLGVSLSGTGKELARRAYAPGDHGRDRHGKLSEYGTQLREKQKLRFMYGMTERQFSNLFVRAGKIKEGTHGANFMALLERRLDNMVVKGTAMAKQRFGKHIITTSVEHAAVRHPTEQLKELGFDVTYLPVDKEGRINPADLKAAIRPDTILVSIMAVNNEIGTIQPIKEVGEILKDYPNIHFHVDAVQAIGKGIDDAVFSDRVDFATFSGHKFHAPRGTGFVYVKAVRKLAPLVAGGGQERGLRSGTENTPGDVAMARAIRLVKEGEADAVKREQAIKERIYDHIKQFDHVKIFSGRDQGFAPHILCFAIVGVRGETIVHAFEDQGIYISTTSACSSKKHAEAGTLAAMKVPENEATSAVRISLGDQNTLEEADQFNKTFDKLYAGFKKIIE